MNTYAVSDQNASTGNPLCDRLRSKYSARGANLVRARQAAPSARTERVKRTLDPFENAPSAQPYRSSARPANTASARPARMQNTARPADRVQRTSASRTQTASRAAAGNAALEARRQKSAAVAAARVRESTPVEEMTIARTPFPFAALTLLLIFAAMMFVIILSFSQNYVLNNEISRLENQASDLMQQEKDLSLRLEERDDIRVIEDVAVNEIGMVKGSLVENRFVSVSGGDRVEILESTDTADTSGEYGFFSNMLSAIGENLDRLRAYFD